jgi:hypothetical protein
MTVIGVPTGPLFGVIEAARAISRPPFAIWTPSTTA